MKKIQTLGCVFKTVERCNIDCKYCYFFNGKDDSYKNHSPYVNIHTIEQTAKFFRQGCIDLDIDRLVIGFHGGEPMMQKKADFSKMCQTFIEYLSDITAIHFNMQTNGMLINEEWIDLFGKYKVHVGISIDGSKDENDIYRVDKRNRGTYDRVIAGIKLMQNSEIIQKMSGLGILCVINPEFSGRKIYRHFVDDLNIKDMDFLFQHFTYDDIRKNPDLDLDSHFDYLIEIFEEWIKDDDPEIEVRVLNSSLEQLMGGVSHTYGNGARSQGAFPLITISSNGDLSPVDDIRSTDPKLMDTGQTVFNSTLRNFLEIDAFKKIKNASEIVPKECQRCFWLEACGSGDITNRYDSQTQDFNHPSVFCSGLKRFYQKLSVYALNNGYPFSELVKTLKIKEWELFQSC